jgi:hypothetical protein
VEHQRLQVGKHRNDTPLITPTIDVVCPGF